MPYREFVDHGGVAWRVWDTRPHSAANVRSRYADGWLSFECVAERRRLSPIPAGWAEAGVDELSSWAAASEPIRVVGELPGRETATGAGPDGRKAPEGASQAVHGLESTRAAVARARAVIRSIDVLAGTAPPPARDEEPRTGRDTPDPKG